MAQTELQTFEGDLLIFKISLEGLSVF